MKYLVSLAAWISGTLAMIVAMCLSLPLTFVLTFRGRTKLGKVIMRFLTAAFFVRVRLENREKVDRSRSHLFMANHASFFDLFILAGYLPGEIRGIEASEHFSWPLWGWLMKRLDMIPIDRKDARASLKSIALAVAYLQRGISVLILPESTRTRDGRMLPFKKLPFKLAKKGGTDIVPVGLVGTFSIKPKTRWWIKPGRVRVRFGDPIPADRVDSDGISDLMETTRRRIAELVGEEDPGPRVSP
jgi:1-acyl-sn-glycerol-3-phosphate acyltransferase